MIGSLQWTISLDCFAIQTATMTMSHFCTVPKNSHLERLKKVYGYLQRFQSARIRLHFEETIFSSLSVQDSDWLNSVYGKVKEDIAINTPES
jgi:hypothetical protein